MKSPSLSLSLYKYSNLSGLPIIIDHNSIVLWESFVFSRGGLNRSLQINFITNVSTLYFLVMRSRVQLFALQVVCVFFSPLFRLSAVCIYSNIGMLFQLLFPGAIWIAMWYNRKEYTPTFSVYKSSDMAKKWFSYSFDFQRIRHSVQNSDTWILCTWCMYCCHLLFDLFFIFVVTFRCV